MSIKFVAVHKADEATDVTIKREDGSERKFTNPTYNSLRRLEATLQNKGWKIVPCLGTQWIIIFYHRR